MQSLTRIVTSARELFVEVGYDAATLRKIAERSDLALGTLFHYISDKRDLIYLIFNEEMETLTDMALAAPRPTQSFREKILSITAPQYQFMGRDPALSRILLSEIQQHSPGMHLARYLKIRARLIGGLETLTAEAKESGEIRSGEEPKVIALSIFFCFTAAARWWLAAGVNPNWRSGQKDFARILNVIVDGLTQLAAAEVVAKAGPRKSTRTGRRGKSPVVSRLRNRSRGEPNVRLCRPVDLSGTVSRL